MEAQESDCNNRKCAHSEWRSGHCAEMICENYVNKCPEHGLAGVCNER